MALPTHLCLLQASLSCSSQLPSSRATLQGLFQNSPVLLGPARTTRQGVTVPAPLDVGRQNQAEAPVSHRKALLSTETTAQQRPRLPSRPATSAGSGAQRSRSCSPSTLRAALRPGSATAPAPLRPFSAMAPAPLRPFSPPWQRRRSAPSPPRSRRRHRGSCAVAPLSCSRAFSAIGRSSGPGWLPRAAAGVVVGSPAASNNRADCVLFSAPHLNARCGIEQALG